MSSPSAGSTSNAVRELRRQLVGGDPGVEPVDRLDAELVRDQLADERQRQLGAGVAALGAPLVAVLARDRVPVVSVGDERGRGADGLADLPQAVGVADAFDDVLDTVDADRADRLAGFLQERREAGVCGQAPDGGEVGVGGAGELQAVGGRLGRRAFVGEDLARALVDDLERAEDAAQLAVLAGRVGEAAPVDREGGVVVGDEVAGGEPLVQGDGRLAVPVVPAARDVDVDDVVRVPGGQLVDVRLREHVVRRRGDLREVVGRGIPDRTEGFEGGHGAQPASPGDRFRRPLALQAFAQKGGPNPRTKEPLCTPSTGWSSSSTSSS